MEKEFIPYELTLKLKELGFDEECLAFYIKIGEKMCINMYTNNNRVFTNKILYTPLWQQAFDWFREKHGFLCSIDWSWMNREKEIIFWDYSVGYDLNRYLLDKRYILESKEVKQYKTYEEARLECLKKLIELVVREYEAD